MKFSLTINTDNPEEIERILTAINGGSSVADDDAGSVSTATVDTTGLPYDERIHAAGRKTNADGSWRKKRGVDDAYYAAIVASLRGAPAAPPAPVMMTAPAAPMMPPAPTPPAPVMAAPAGGDFPTLMMKINASIQRGQFTNEWLNSAIASYGLTSINDLISRPDIIKTFGDFLKTNNLID